MQQAANSTVDITFVLPAYNEELQIGETIRLIYKLMADRFTFQVVVVDNGSTDKTASIALQEGAHVIDNPSGTIGASRNRGARAANGRLLVFLDADVHITPQWVENLPRRLEQLLAAPRTLMGSICGVPADASWIERSWFDPMQRNHRVTHIGSGHLLTTRAFYEELGGFSEVLRTGEDYELSTRALAIGGALVDTPELFVEHLGYPSTVRQFVKREMWHGEGDFTSIRAIARSKVALLTVAFIIAHLALLVALVSGRWSLATLFAGAVWLLCAFSAAVKYRGRPLQVITRNTVLYYAYFIGRAAAFFKGIAGAVFPGIAASSARSATRRSVLRSSQTDAEAPLDR